MRINSDARPQARVLIIAALMSLALWFMPMSDVFLYPFRIFVTFIHEGGHAIAAILTGNSVGSLSVATDGSGETYTTGSGLFSQMLVSSAGYLGSMAFGALLLVLIRRKVSSKLVLVGTSALIALLTLGFGLFKPLFSGSLSTLAGVPFTLLAGTILTVGLFAVARFASARVAGYFVAFLAVQCVLNAFLDLKSLLFLSAPGMAVVPTDALNMANATGIPAIVWAFIWTLLAFLILSAVVRLYYVSSRRSDPQQDLPFETPLDI
jgi:Peptidase M50B-like